MMKKNLLLLIFSLFVINANSQTCSWHEDFENPDSVSSAGTPGWAANTSYQTSGIQSFHAQVVAGDTMTLSTASFNTTGNFFVQMRWKHICKIEFFDFGIIEVSNDGGATWVQLVEQPVPNFVYVSAGSPFGALSNKFSSASYAIWDPANNAAIPDNATWWQEEIFDISQLLGNVANAMVRFRLYDSNGNGSAGAYGWLIDDLCIEIAPSETNPPVITLTPPLYDCPFVYNIGPFDINADIQDASGLSSALVYYTVNGGPLDSVAMVNQGGNAWLGTIPAVTNGDTVCYYITAIDNSPVLNASSYPTSGCLSFIAFNGIAFPYYDNFDCSNSLWTPSSLGGSQWELGTPQFGATTGAHSPPNAWDIDLFSPYINNTTAYLESPAFDFTSVTLIRMSFWQNRNTQLNSDGFFMEYSINNGPWSTLGVVNDPNGVNWYSNTLFSGAAAWDGSSGGWVKSEYEISGAPFVGAPNVRFRFVFTSDGFTFVDGVSVDDFSLTLPCPLDAGVSAIVAPCGAAGSGQTISPVVTIRNYGTSNITSMDVCYSVNGGAPVCTTWTGNLQPGAQLTQDINLDSLVVPGVSFSFCAWTDLPGDCDHLNDTTCCNVTVVQVITLPYCDDFEGLNPGWISIPSTQSSTEWQLGTPAFGQTTGAHSGTMAWDVDLSSGYLGNAETYLVSPFFDLSGVFNPRMSAWLNWNAENSWDGGRLDYTTDGGNTWNVLGTVAPDPNGTNWYNFAALNSSGQPGWSNTSIATPYLGNPWVQVKYENMSFLSNLSAVQFRFAFTSDAIIENDGFSVDDFCLMEPPPLDAGVKRITAPGFASPAGSATSVSVMIRNFGSTSLSSIPVAYSVNAGAPVQETWTGTPVAPGDSVPYTFTTTFVSPANNYTLCAYTELVGDGDLTNDTVCKTTFGIPYLPVPYSTNFDTGAVDWAGETAPSNLIAWELGPPNYGATTGAFSAPNSWDINLNTFYNGESNIGLYTPIFDFSAAINATLSFWQNRSTQAFNDGTRLEYTTDGGATWTVLDVNVDPLAQNWYTNQNIFSSGLPAWDGQSSGQFGIPLWVKSIINVNFLSGESQVQFRFVFSSTLFAFGDGQSIDDFSITIPPPIDAGVVAVISPPGQAPAGTVVPVIVTLKNFGTQTLNTFDVSYDDGSGPVTHTWNGTLAPAQTVNDTFPGYTVPSGQFNICAYTTLAGDGDNSNDTTCVSPVGVPVLIPTYCDNFETGNIGWTSVSPLGGSTWQLGTPNFGQTTGAHQGTMAWDIDLNSGYTGNAEAYLYTPLFDMTSTINASISFWHNRNTEQAWDGMRVEYTTNGGANWNVLGAVGSPGSTNWYNNAALISSGLPGWDGTSNGWIKSEFNLSFLNGTPLAQFRFVFTSDVVVQLDGYSIDDFCMKQPSPLDAGVIAINSPGFQSPAGTSITPDVNIQNFGTNTLTSVDVEYTVNGVITGSATWTGTLTPNSVAQVTNLPPFNAPSGGYSFCAYTKLPGDGDNFNDTMCINSVGVPVIIPSYFDDFNSGNIGWSTATGPAGSASQWQLGTPSFGQTNSAYSPPTCWDIDLTSGYLGNAFAYLYTPIFDFTNSVNDTMSFWRNHATEAAWDGTRVEYSTNGTNWSVLGAVGSPGSTNWYNNASLISSGLPGWDGNSGGWVYSEIPLSFLNAQPMVQFRFVFTSDVVVELDGFSIDDFEIEVPIALTVNPNTIATTAGQIALPGPQLISARITNKGTTPVSSVDATLTVGGIPIVTDALTFNPPLTSLQSSPPHVFSVPWNAPPGCHDVVVYTTNPNLSADLDPSDDTTFKQICVFDSATVTFNDPYCNDFESGPSWVTLNAFTLLNQTTIWTIGTPSKPVLNTTHSGSNAWVTDLTQDYPNRDTSGLFSPVFYVNSGTCYKLSFWHQFDTEQFQDGGTVDYSLDGGLTWQVFGYATEPNWMNSFFITALGGMPPSAGWSGTTGNWVFAEHTIGFAAPDSIIFRWRFGSDFTVTYDGWAIDDVCFEETTSPCVVGIGEPPSEAFFLDQNYPNPAGDLTYISFYLPKPGEAELFILNMLGERVNTIISGEQPHGTYTIELNTSTMADGIYYYALVFEGKMMVKKMMIAR